MNIGQYGVNSRFEKGLFAALLLSFPQEGEKFMLSKLASEVGPDSNAIMELLYKILLSWTKLAMKCR